MIQKNKSYFKSNKNKYISKPILNSFEPYVFFKNYCIKGTIDWDFLSEEEEYTCPRDKKIVYCSVTGKDLSYYPPMPYKKYIPYTQKKFVSEIRYSGPKDHYF